MENEKILGLYGGTFDPPHIAHISLAKAFLKEFEGASLTVMPCLIPPHKQRLGGADGKARLEMARLAFKGIARVSDFEISKKRTSYTYLTVKHLMRRYPSRKICIIMGQDNLEILEKWREYRFLIEHCMFAVALRGGEVITPAVERLRGEYGAEIHLLAMERLDVSSTEIRRLLKENKSTEGLLPDGVEEYIKREGLYL